VAAKPTRTGRPAWTGDGLIGGIDDVRRVLADANAAGLKRDNTALAVELVQSADEVALTEADIARVLPAVPEIAELLPWPGGSRRGATLAAVGSTSLLMTLLAGAMTQGSWAAVVGMPAFGALAAAEAGVPLDRLALVPAPGPDWPTVVSALIDGLDVVVIATPPGVPEATTRALINRAKQRGCVLIPTTRWPQCVLTIVVNDRHWVGLHAGHGRLRRQDVTLRASGRGRAARPTTVTTPLPPPSIVGHRIADMSEMVIPPPAQAPAAPTPPPTRPWQDIQHNAPPVDPWAALQHRLPPIERKRRY
jgi:hypothetical protein